MVQLSLSADANIRSQLMAQIRAITNSNLLDISDKVKQILCERARDKIVRTRVNFLELPRVFVPSGKFARRRWIISVTCTRRNAFMLTGPMRFRNN